MGSADAVTPPAAFGRSLRGKQGARAGPAWVRVGPGSGLRRPLADRSCAHLWRGGTQRPQAPPPRPHLTPLYPGCPDAWTEAAGRAVGLPVLAASPYAWARPCPPGSFRVAPPAAQFPGDRFPATARGGPARSPASGSRAERGRLWLRRRASQGGSAEAGGWLERPPGSAAPRVGHVGFPGLGSRVPKTRPGTGPRGTTASKSLGNVGPASA